MIYYRFTKVLFLVVGLFSVSVSVGQAPRLAGNRISTEWASKVNAAAPLPEYPRPQMVRENNWINLNGYWQYDITPRDTYGMKENSGQILVPYPVESALSGVGKTVGKDSVLWYRRHLDIPSSFRKKKLLLHFGAVDWKTEVFVNGISAGTHEGGYDPFSMDITPHLRKGTRQEITVKVWDPTDQGPQPRGKQVRKPEGIWYTPVTGIWQTVWLEAVPSSFINFTKHTPDIDRKTVTIESFVEGVQSGDKISIVVLDNGNTISNKQFEAGSPAVIDLENVKLWSPETPHLYDLKISLVRKGKTIDQVGSYFAMRKSSMAPGPDQVQRMMLNDKFLFQYGPLDQGWWPDGLYTAPTDEALKFDIEKTKEMGFNMIRKHVKVEPARWYYHCDKLGMLVWQDMPSGDLGNRWEPRPFVIGLGADKTRSPESEKIFRTEWKAIIESLYNFPSIVVWTPFNEAWGQFKTEEIVDMTYQLDSTRLINTASGGNYVAVGDIIDMHNYPDPAIPDPAIFGREQAIVLGEFGGLGLPVPGNTWQDKNWGYQSFGSADSLFNRYDGLLKKIEQLIPLGLSAAVYTQTTDVEGEVNGLFTYDRKLLKMPIDKLRIAHKRLYEVPMTNKN